MAGVLFFINIPCKKHEQNLREQLKSSKLSEKEKYENASKIIRELKKNKRFGSIHFEHGIDKSKSLECLDGSSDNGLVKSKSDNMVNESYKWDVGSQFDRKSWRVKQAMRPRKRKLQISRPLSIMELTAFHLDTPLEIILSEVITQLGINNVTWSSTRENMHWQVLFSLESSDLSEELLQVLANFGIGTRFESSVSVIPCALHFKADANLACFGNEAQFKRNDVSAWTRFSSSVRARTNLAQVLHAVRADAALTFDWLFLLVVAAFVAAIGLAENSTVILVASMLISPLMGPITAGTLGTAVHDRSLQQMGVLHELLGLFLALIIGFLFGLTISAVDGRYGVGDWPTYEMMTRCELRSLWVGVLVAIPSGAGVALAVLGEYTASLVGVAISASLLPPAVNAGLLWAMALVHLIFADDQSWTGVVTSFYYSNDPATELAILGSISLCLTLVNIACIFLAGVAVYKVKEVCPLEHRDILWWRADRQSHRSSKRNILRNNSKISWEKYSNWSNECPKMEEQDREEPITPVVQSDTVTYRHETPGIRRMRAQNIEAYCLQKEQLTSLHNYESNLDGGHIYTSIENITPKPDLADIVTNTQSENFYNNNCITDLDDLDSFCNPGFEEQGNFRENLRVEQRIELQSPIIEPSCNLTVNAPLVVLGNAFKLFSPAKSCFFLFDQKCYIITVFCLNDINLVLHILRRRKTKPHLDRQHKYLVMPSGVIFVVCIPSSNYEHVLRFGKPKNFPIQTPPSFKPQLEVELRNKKPRSIPVQLTQGYYNEAFATLDDIKEEDKFFTLESILQEVLNKLEVTQVVWISDKAGNFFEVLFPLPTGDECETMLHCLTQLGIGVKWKSIVSVLPCSVVHSAVENEDYDEDTIIRKSEEAKRWRSFVESIRSKLTVKQVVDGVRGGGELSFDYLTLIITADSLAALGLVENNASNIVAAMLVSPLMGPVMSITFGTIIADRSLVRSGFESLVLGMFFSLVFGFIFGLILGTTDMPWGFGDWPTEEMKSRGNVRALWMGVLWALTSGTGVALALLQGSAGPLIGIAISASLLPPVVNCGLYWALACIWLLYPGVKIPHIKGEAYTGNSSYQPLYHDYLPIEFAVNGIVSCCLTIVNVICIFITAIMFLKIKEVAAPYTSTPDLRRFWAQDIRVVREANRANLHEAEQDERAELVLEDLNQGSDEDIKEKLEAAVQEALDDETYRKVKRMSYQSHNADEVFRTIGMQSRTPVSLRSSTHSSIASPRPSVKHPSTKKEDIAALDKLLTSLLGSDRDKRTRSFRSHRGTPRSSRMPVINENNRRSESWPERIFENSVVSSVLNNLRTSQRNSAAEEPFLTPN